MSGGCVIENSSKEKKPMKYAGGQSYLMKVNTSDCSVSKGWDLLVSRLDQEDVGFMSASLENTEASSGAAPSLMKFITTLSLHGKSDILVKVFGLCSTGPLPSMLAKKALLGVLWDTFQSSWEGWTPEQKINVRAQTSIQRCMERDVECVSGRYEER